MRLTQQENEEKKTKVCCYKWDITSTFTFMTDALDTESHTHTHTQQQMLVKISPSLKIPERGISSGTQMR